MKTQLIRCAILCCAAVLASFALAETAMAQADTVMFWNVSAINAIRTAGPSLGALATPRGSRVMAMVHVAMADSVTSIHPVYKPYAIRLVGHGSADQIAAASAAAYGVLVRLFPSQQSSLEAALAQSLAQVPNGRKKDEGVAVGDEVAARIVALRSKDGSDVMMTYTPPAGLGYWRPDPRTGPSPFLSWRFVTPWTMPRADQFRPGPPPSIYDPLFVRDLAEVRQIGGIGSSVPTWKQETIARFVTENPLFQYNRLERLVATAAPKPLEANARAFAILAMVLADACISAYDAKFEYNFWRPWTA